MMTTLRQSVVMLVLLTVVTGIVYPLLVTGIAQVTMPDRANGSIICRDGQAVGSERIAQPFSQRRYFWPRPSATSPVPYDAANSGGSNLGPTNPALEKTVTERAQALREADPAHRTPVPVDLVTASGSGLDPEISPAGAEYQVARVARERRWPEAKVRALVAEHTRGRTLGVLGEPRVNVLMLNLALDAAAK